MTATFDFEEHGRSPGRYQKWSDKLKKSSTVFPPEGHHHDNDDGTKNERDNSDNKKKKTKKKKDKKKSDVVDKNAVMNVEAWSQYEKKPLLNAGICGGERDMLTTGCLPSILRRFVSKGCLDEMHEFMLLIPFYYTLFRKPSPAMVKALRMIRRRLKLVHPYQNYLPFVRLSIIILLCSLPEEYLLSSVYLLANRNSNATLTPTLALTRTLP